MQSPFLIGLLSIIPGLGFFVLGKPRRGFGVIGILLVLLIMFLFIPGDFITQISFQMAILVWVGQIYLAAQSAKLIKKQQAGEVTTPRDISKIEIPSGLSLKERGTYRIREIVRQQLNPGEELLETVFAQTVQSVGSMAVNGALTALKASQYYIGLTEESLIMIEVDSFGTPADIKRLPLTGIKSSKLKKRLLADDLILDFGEKKPMKLQVNAGFRNQTRALFEKLQDLI